MESCHEYRLLTIQDVEPAANVLAQAFVDDPLCSYMLPRHATRVKTLRIFFRLWGEGNIKEQRGFGAGDPLQAVAYWQFPDHESTPNGKRSLRKYIPLLFTFYPIGYLRAKTVLKQIHTLHEKNADQPHYYLDYLGVLPSAQGKGLASELIRPFLEMADAQKVMAYTDTVTRANVSLYEHFGFRCIEERPVAGTGITVWALRRPAQTGITRTRPD